MIMRMLRRLTMLAGVVEAVRRYIRNNPDKVNKVAGRAGKFVDKRTNGKFHRQVDGAVQKVRATTHRVSH
jgi:hypothetical protein